MTEYVLQDKRGCTVFTSSSYDYLVETAKEFINEEPDEMYYISKLQDVCEISANGITNFPSYC